MSNFPGTKPQFAAIKSVLAAGKVEHTTLHTGVARRLEDKGLLEMFKEKNTAGTLFTYYRLTAHAVGLLESWGLEAPEPSNNEDCEQCADDRHFDCKQCSCCTAKKIKDSESDAFGEYDLSEAIDAEQNGARIPDHCINGFLGRNVFGSLKHPVPEDEEVDQTESAEAEEADSKAHDTKVSRLESTVKALERALQSEQGRNRELRNDSKRFNQMHHENQQQTITALQERLKRMTEARDRLLDSKTKAMPRLDALEAAQKETDWQKALLEAEKKSRTEDNEGHVKVRQQLADSLEEQYELVSYLRKSLREAQEKFYVEQNARQHQEKENKALRALLKLKL